MSRLADRFAALKAEGRTALTTFITAGDPNHAATVPALHALVAGGADVLELGVPFSDPEAEGPAIQASSERGLRSGTTLAMCLDMVREFRKEDPSTPVVLMGYLNSVLAMGERTFATAAGEAGVDGLIMVNLPPEEAADLSAALKGRANVIFLTAPTSTDTRLGRIAQSASGFIYYVSLKGITGADHIDADSVRDNVARLRKVTDLPVLVGFGIKDATTARIMAQHSDGVVVGSALVNAMHQRAGDPEGIPAALEGMLGEMRCALDEC